jgi:hypothetical protein
MMLRNYWRQLLITAISIVFAANILIRHYGHAHTGSWLVAITMSLLASAVAGSWFKRYWVQYCFYVLGLINFLSLIIAIFSTTAVILKSAPTVVLTSIKFIALSTIVFSVGYLFVCYFLYAGFLSKRFFDSSPNRGKYKIFWGLIMATGVGNCLFLLWLSIVQFMPGPGWISMFHPTAWLFWVLFATHHLMTVLIPVGLPLLLLAVIFKKWRLWHSLVAGLTITGLYFGLMIGLSFPTYTFKTSITLACAFLFPLVGMAATKLGFVMRRYYVTTAHSAS